MAVERIIGIDFGTSTSVIRVMIYKDGKPTDETLDAKAVVFGEGNTVVPTLIAKKTDGSGEPYYGYETQDKNRGFTVYSNFKMELESDNSEKRATARELTEEFLKYMGKEYRQQRDDGHFGNADKERTIISYPVKWKQETKQFMEEAAVNAGFPNVSGMDEAHAAIHAVTTMKKDLLAKSGLLHDEKPANILLIDMGAGTTDLVLCRHTFGTKATTEILCTWPQRGKLLFSGGQVDRLLKGFFQSKLGSADACELLKHIGTDQYKVWKEITVSPTLKKNGAVTYFTALDTCAEMMGIELDEYSLDRAALENCLEDYLRQLPLLVNACLYNVNVQGDVVDLVIVTGGHSQWYFVQEILAGRMAEYGHVNLEKMQEDPSRIVSITRPQETVALGLVFSPMNNSAIVLEKGNSVETNNSISDTVKKPQEETKNDRKNKNEEIREVGKETKLDNNIPKPKSKQKEENDQKGNRRLLTAILIILICICIGMIMNMNNEIHSQKTEINNLKNDVASTQNAAASHSNGGTKSTEKTTQEVVIGNDSNELGAQNVPVKEEKEVVVPVTTVPTEPSVCSVCDGYGFHTCLKCKGDLECPACKEEREYTPDSCALCGGTGLWRNKTCSMCDGTGVDPYAKYLVETYRIVAASCDTCGGTGKFCTECDDGVVECSACGGLGIQ